MIYSAMTGTKIVSHSPEVNMGLGIRTLSPAPNQKMLACGTYDSNLVIYNTCNQTQIGELTHKASVQIDTRPDPATSQTDIFKEELVRQQDGRA